jgi:hypothetical protein
MAVRGREMFWKQFLMRTRALAKSNYAKPSFNIYAVVASASMCVTNWEGTLNLRLMAV